MFISGNKEACNYYSSHFKDKLYVLCIIIRFLIGLTFLYMLINDNLIRKYYNYILIFFGFILLSFIYKYSLCGITNWKNYSKTIIIYSIIFILLLTINKFNSRQHYIYLVISILIIIDTLFGIQSKFNYIKYHK